MAMAAHLPNDLNFETSSSSGSSSDSENSVSNHSSVLEVDQTDGRTPTHQDEVVTHIPTSYGPIKLTQVSNSPEKEDGSQGQVFDDLPTKLGQEALEAPEGELTETGSSASDLLSSDHVKELDEKLSSQTTQNLASRIGGEAASPLIGRGLFLKKPISEETKISRGRNSLTGVNRLGSLSPTKKSIPSEPHTPVDNKRSLVISGSPEVLSEASKIMETAKLRNSSNGPRLSKEAAGPATSKAQAAQITKRSGKDIGSAPSSCASCIIS